MSAATLHGPFDQSNFDNQHSLMALPIQRNDSSFLISKERRTDDPSSTLGTSRTDLVFLTKFSQLGTIVPVSKVS